MKGKPNLTVGQVCNNYLLSKTHEPEYVGGDKRDIVQYRKTFLHRMVSIGFLNESCTPTEEAKVIQKDIHGPSCEVIKNTCFSKWNYHTTDQGEKTHAKSSVNR